jgi:hypothetical protein
MKKMLSIISFLFLIYYQGIFSQSGTDTEVYLLTCGPGTETYSIYGHSAIRIVIPEKSADIVYNWGVFDFSTPNFAWKFAKGRLDYMIGAGSLQSFLQIYLFEQRFVYSQRINLDANETEHLMTLINENLKPENINYRYDFFYDDCSTRIRDLLEKSIGEKLLYPPVESGETPTFRDMVGKYQNPYPWLKFGVDLIMGSYSDINASSRDRMFLPIDLKNELSETVINRNSKMIPLLQDPEFILDFDPPVIRQKFFISPVFVFTLLLIIVIIFSALFKSKKINNLTDIFIYSVFSILALLMIFFNFFTDHQQMKWNLNIIWLNPVIIICLIALIMNRTASVWFRIAFFISGAFLVIQLFLPQEFNTAFFPLVLILLIRSSVRAGFEWNPLSLR